MSFYSFQISSRIGSRSWGVIPVIDVPVKSSKQDGKVLEIQRVLRK